jgi:hypothetical protein
MIIIHWRVKINQYTREKKEKEEGKQKTKNYWFASRSHLGKTPRQLTGYCH